jgi:hypothetical protein
MALVDDDETREALMISVARVQQRSDEVKQLHRVKSRW